MHYKYKTNKVNPKGEGEKKSIIAMLRFVTRVKIWSRWYLDIQKNGIVIEISNRFVLTGPSVLITK